MLNNLKDKFIRFMYGRYGTDSFCKFLTGTACASFLLSIFFDKAIFSLFAWILLFYCYYRMFSKNIYKRAAENQQFLNRTANIRRKFAEWKYLFSQSRTHHIYKCPTCRQKIRVPRGKGKIEIRCPKCNSTFIKRS